MGADECLNEMFRRRPRPKSPKHHAILREAAAGLAVAAATPDTPQPAQRRHRHGAVGVGQPFHGTALELAFLDCPIHLEAGEPLGITRQIDVGQDAVGVVDFAVGRPVLYQLLPRPVFGIHAYLHVVSRRGRPHQVDHRAGGCATGLCDIDRGYLRPCSISADAGQARYRAQDNGGSRNERSPSGFARWQLRRPAMGTLHDRSSKMTVARGTDPRRTPPA